MKQAHTRPRDYAVESGITVFGDGPVGWRLDEQFPSWSAHKQQHALWQLMAAVSQHEHAQAMRYLLADSQPAVPLTVHCRRWGYDLRRARDVLRGDTAMRQDDWVWMLRSLGPDALPMPSDLAQALDSALESAVGSVGGLKPEVPARITARRT